jgi:MYXO-CTERM domain-containing protein
MRQISLKVAALTAGAVLMLAAQAHAVVINVGDAQGAAGSVVSVSISLESEGDVVAGTENVITFPTGARIAALANGTPDCTVNEAIMKNLSDAFQPPDCEGTACTGYKGIIISLENTDEIPDGSTLYTCNVQIDAAATGTLALACSDPGASDPDGNALDTTCTDGEITVGGAGPTDTPTTGGGATATPTPTTGNAAVNIVVGSANGNIGDTVSIDVSLELPLLGTMVAGTENTITFSGGIGAAISIVAKTDGTPDCTVNEAINKNLSDAFQPPGCSGEECTGYKGIIISLENTDPIPAGVLYTCNVHINDTAADGQTYPLTCSSPGASTPDGDALPTSCTDGAITVGVVGPTATSTVGGATPTNTPGGGSPTPTFPFFPTEFDDGCAIASPADSQAGWLVLLPLAALLWLRRRSR